MYSLWFQGSNKLLGGNFNLKNFTDLTMFICVFRLFPFFLYKMSSGFQDSVDTSQ